MRNSVPAFVLTALASTASAQVVQPGQSAADSAADSRPRDSASRDEHVPSFEAPPRFETVVRGGLREEERIGDYGQPRWTVPRRFPTTRIYVVPRGTLHFEYWLDARLALESPKEARLRSQYEVEIGLGHRLQLDIYLTTQQKGLDAPLALHREKLELRWALADWGVLPANPTLYAELVRQHDAPPLAELKLLLGDELAPRWHWGLNLVYERELGGQERENTYQLTAGLSRTVVDEGFSAGAELKVSVADVAGSRWDFSSVEAYAGPSIQWRPVRPMHLDLVALFGALGERRAQELEFEAAAAAFLVAGWEL